MVGFRYATRDEAVSLELVGWVRNRSDGDVEGVAQGKENNIEAFIKWLWVGPPSAKVHSVDTSKSECGNYETFQIVH